MFDYKYVKTKTSDLLAYRTSDDFNDIKKAMVSDWHTGCHRCRADEMAGKWSLRQNGVRLSGIDGVIEDVEINLSNECNLTCKMCGPKFSTKWQSLVDSNPALNKWTDHQISDQTKPVLSSAMAHIDLSKLKSIKYLGGEPFITKEITDLFQLLDTNNVIKKLSFSCHTNCTFIPQKHLKALSRFGRLEIGLSIDGIGNHAEYIRTGFPWKRIDEVVDKWVDLQQQRAYDGFYDNFYIYTTIQAYNLHHVPEITRYAQSKNIKFLYGFLEYPRYLSVSALPYEYKKEIIRSLYYDPTVPNALAEQASLMRPKPDLLDQLRQYTDDLDKAMDTNIASVIPGLAKHLIERIGS